MSAAVDVSVAVAVSSCRLSVAVAVLAALLSADIRQVPATADGQCGTEIQVFLLLIALR
jgi:hypothetical protein